MSVRKDKTSLMSKLIELGGEPACRDNEGRSCLHLAANNDSASAARILLQHKVRRGNIDTVGPIHTNKSLDTMCHSVTSVSILYKILFSKFCGIF